MASLPNRALCRGHATSKCRAVPVRMGISQMGWISRGGHGGNIAPPCPLAGARFGVGSWQLMIVSR